MSGETARCQRIVRVRGDYEQCVRALGHRGRHKRGTWGERRRKLSSRQVRQITERLLSVRPARCPACGGAVDGFSRSGPVTVMLVGYWRVRERTENEITLQPCGHAFAERARRP